MHEPVHPGALIGAHPVVPGRPDRLERCGRRTVDGSGGARRPDRQAGEDRAEECRVEPVLQRDEAERRGSGVPAVEGHERPGEHDIEHHDGGRERECSCGRAERRELQRPRRLGGGCAGPHHGRHRGEGEQVADGDAGAEHPDRAHARERGGDPEQDRQRDGADEGQDRPGRRRDGQLVEDRRQREQGEDRAADAEQQPDRPEDPLLRCTDHSRPGPGSNPSSTARLYRSILVGAGRPARAYLVRMRRT